MPNSTGNAEAKISDPNAGQEIHPPRVAWYGVLSALALLVRIPAFLAPTELSYDDGVYQTAIRSMRSGHLPFRQVFSAQGPLFYPVVWLGDLLGMQSEHGPRVVPVLSGIIITLCAAWIAGKRSPSAFWITGVLVATSGSLLRTTSALTSDGVALAWAMLALCYALAQCHGNAQRTPPRSKHGLALTPLLILGVLTGCALGTKNLLVLPVFAIVALLIAQHFGLRSVIAFGGLGLAFVVGWMAIWDFKKAYQQSIQYHLEKSAHQTLGVRWHKLATTMWERDLPILAACVVAGVMYAFSRASLGTPDRNRAIAFGLTSRGALSQPIILLWGFLTVGVVLGESAMFANHVSFVVVPLALACAPSDRMRAMLTAPIGRVFRSTSAGAVLGVVLLVAVTVGALEHRSSDFMNPRQPSRAMRSVAEVIEALPNDALGISDEPGILSLAGMEVPAFFVDGSRMRLESKVPGIQLTTDLIARESQKDKLCLVLVWNPNIWGTLAELPRRLESLGYSATDLGYEHILYRKSSNFCGA